MLEAAEIKIGSDKVVLSGDELFIYSQHKMQDWKVREFQPVPIYFREKNFYCSPC